MRPYRVFTLSEANRAVREVNAVTRTVRDKLEEIRSAFEGTDSDAAEDLEDETREALTGWEQEIYKIGAEPKGIFTVDFRSPDPNVLWCWTTDEPEITHRHFTWESFKDRVPISIEKRGWPSSN